jgi:hypothetical protein
MQAASTRFLASRSRDLRLEPSRFGQPVPTLSTGRRSSDRGVEFYDGGAASPRLTCRLRCVRWHGQEQGLVLVVLAWLVNGPDAAAV